MDHYNFAKCFSNALRIIYTIQNDDNDRAVYRIPRIWVVLVTSLKRYKLIRARAIALTVRMLLYVNFAGSDCTPVDTITARIESAGETRVLFSRAPLCVARNLEISSTSAVPTVWSVSRRPTIFRDIRLFTRETEVESQSIIRSIRVKAIQGNANFRLLV